MTKASTALHHILTTYPITPAQLTTALQIPTATFTAWLQGHLDPPADRLAALISTLHHLNPQAAKDVIQLYLEDESGGWIFMGLDTSFPSNALARCAPL